MPLQNSAKPTMASEMEPVSSFIGDTRSRSREPKKRPTIMPAMKRLTDCVAVFLLKPSTFSTKSAPQ